MRARGLAAEVEEVQEVEEPEERARGLTEEAEERPRLWVEQVGCRPPPLWSALEWGSPF